MIRFFYEDTTFKLKDIRKHKRWVESVFLYHNQESPSEICYIFCSDNYLLKINQDHLGHDYFTDIITFPIQSSPLEANIFISIDRVLDNASKLELNFNDELKRVMIHGVLHLIGFKDKTKEEQKMMRLEEDKMTKLFE